MTDLLAARSLMAMSLGFHIIFAVVGIGLPLMMVIAEWRWLRTGEEVYLTLTQRWAKGTAVLFAVGAISGTVLSFQLGLLWPGFMAWAGPIIGLAFSLEGFAFFAEAIFLGLYLYGWGRLSPAAHLGAGIVVAVSGAVSAVFVVLANGWMHTPRGFRLLDGQPTEIDPLAAMLNPSGLAQVPHMILAAYAATGFVIAGIHAFRLLRDPDNQFHQRAFAIACVVGGVSALFQPVSGDILAKVVAEHQPAKLAAFEGQFSTESGAPFRLGGIPDLEQGRLRYAIEIPYALSLMLYLDPHATVAGLDAVPREEWPPVGVVRAAFQIMFLAGVWMAAVALWGGWLWWRRGSIVRSRRFLQTMVVSAPLGFLAIEAGWTATEVGRQPWIIAGVMRTAEAVTPMPGLIVPLIFFGALYLFLAAVVVWVLFHQIGANPRGEPVRRNSGETRREELTVPASGTAEKPE
ncbi:MAG: cytochrome ubiquinol oxidase subunit I [Nitrospirota bacterium]|nr:cytochrome ubiquinol oxidase subunit I [Nitrospirota bacterium]